MLKPELITLVENQKLELHEQRDRYNTTLVENRKLGTALEKITADYERVAASAARASEAITSTLVVKFGDTYPSCSDGYPSFAAPQVSIPVTPRDEHQELLRYIHALLQL